MIVLCGWAMSLSLSPMSWLLVLSTYCRVLQTANTTSPVRVAREGPKNVTGVIGDGDDSFIACRPFAVEIRGAMSYG